jgi:hypothetical protein
LVAAFILSGDAKRAAGAKWSADQYVQQWRERAADEQLFARSEKIFSTNRLVAESFVEARSSDSDDQARRKALARLHHQILLEIKDPQRQDLDMYLLVCEFVTKSEDAVPEDLESTIRRIAFVTTQFGELLTDTGNQETGYFKRYANAAIPTIEYLKSKLPDAKLEQEHQSLLIVSNATTNALTNGRGALLESPDELDSVSPGRLHTLTIGLSEYKDQTLNLQYGHDDAKVLHATFQLLCSENEYGMFERGVQINPLTNQAVTRKSVWDFIGRLQEVPEDQLKRDFVIISMSGHAIRDRFNNLWFLCHDYDPKSLESTAIELKYLQLRLAQLDTKVLLILDCCHAGEASNMSDFVAFKGVEDEEIRRAWREFSDAGSEVAVLSASLAGERANESSGYAGHGALTAAVIEYLTQKHFDEIETRDNVQPANLRRIVNNALTLEGLRGYVVERVRQFKGPKQNPTLKHLLGTGDFSDASVFLRKAPLVGTEK